MKELEKILELDKRIRYVSKITHDGDFLDYVYRDDLNLEMKKENQKSMGMHVSILSDTHRRMDRHLGKVSATISLRPNLVSLVIYVNGHLYSISFDGCDEYYKVV